MRQSQHLHRVAALADGRRSSKEIAEILGLQPRHVRKILKRYSLNQLTRGAQPGRENHQFVSGRRIDLDGYVVVTAPGDHPAARPRANRNTKVIYEHRLVAERKIGRYLDPQEVVDHIDGLTLHNHPDNLRVFASNAEHLAATISGGGSRNWSPQGWANIGTRSDLGREYQRVDSYGQNRKRGDVRLRQILLAALKLGTDSPFLSGTRRHLEKAQIDVSSRTTIERALADLSARWVGDRAP